MVKRTCNKNSGVPVLKIFAICQYMLESVQNIKLQNYCCENLHQHYTVKKSKFSNPN
jgi:hypothetical protein